MAYGQNAPSYDPLTYFISKLVMLFSETYTNESRFKSVKITFDFDYVICIVPQFYL